jgi:hypothetical protein
MNRFDGGPAAYIHWPVKEHLSFGLSGYYSLLRIGKHLENYNYYNWQLCFGIRYTN